MLGRRRVRRRRDKLLMELLELGDRHGWVGHGGAVDAIDRPSGRVRRGRRWSELAQRRLLPSLAVLVRRVGDRVGVVPVEGERGHEVVRLVLVRRGGHKLIQVEVASARWSSFAHPKVKRRGRDRPTGFHHRDEGREGWGRRGEKKERERKSSDEGVGVGEGGKRRPKEGRTTLHGGPPGLAPHNAGTGQRPTSTALHKTSP